MAKAIQTVWRHHAPYISGTALSEHDALPFFNGRKIPDVETVELVRLLQARGIPDVSPNKPRSENLDIYARHIAGIHNAAARINPADAAWRCSDCIRR